MVPEEKQKRIAVCEERYNWAVLHFKLRHMENRMNSAVRRQFQFVSHFPNLDKDGIGSKVFESQLMICPRSDRRLNVRLHLEINRVTHFK